MVKLVRPGQEPTGHERLQPCRPRVTAVGADVGVEHRVDRQQSAVGVETGLNLIVMVASMGRGLQMFDPVLNPRHRPVQTPRHLGHHQVFGIERGLDPEAPAGVTGNDADLMVGQAQNPSQLAPVDVRSLRREVHGQRLVGIVPDGNGCSTLEWYPGVAVRAVDALEHKVGGDERGVDLAGVENPTDQHVVGGRVVHRIGDRPVGGDRVDVDRQFLVVDDHQLGAVLGQVSIVGHHCGHRLTLEPDLVRGQRWLRRFHVAG